MTLGHTPTANERGLERIPLTIEAAWQQKQPARSDPQ